MGSSCQWHIQMSSLHFLFINGILNLPDQYDTLLLWTECLCPTQIDMLKLKFPVWWYLEVGPWGSHDNGAPRKEKHNRDDYFLLSIVWGHGKKMALCKPEGRFSPDAGSAGTLILNFLASQTVRNEFLLLMPPSLWYSGMAAQCDSNK